MNRKQLISVVVPVYFNEESISELTAKFEELAGRNPHLDFEFIFVDDDSKDNSFNLLISYLHTSKHKVKVLKLSKNFGSFTACLAGLEKSTGDCSAILAADLQDPPEILDKMIALWNDGNEVVIASRKSREDPILSKIFSKIYYKILRKFALKDMPEGGFDFVLMDRKVRNILCEIKEKNTSLMGLILWSGFKREIIYYDRKARKYGKSKWTFAKTMPGIRHCYIVKDNLSEADKEQFDELKWFIRKNGYAENFYPKQYKYFNINNYKYWLVGNILNRATT